MPDVVIIGAGPAGSVAAALLPNAQLEVAVLERTPSPRSSLGQSPLPPAMESLPQASLIRHVVHAAHTHKTTATPSPAT